MEEEPRPDDEGLQETQDLVLPDEESSEVVGGKQRPMNPPAGPVPIPYPNEL